MSPSSCYTFFFFGVFELEFVLSPPCAFSCFLFCSVARRKKPSLCFFFFSFEARVVRHVGLWDIILLHNAQVRHFNARFTRKVTRKLCKCSLGYFQLWGLWVGKGRWGCLCIGFPRVIYLFCTTFRRVPREHLCRSHHYHQQCNDRQWPLSESVVVTYLYSVRSFSFFFYILETPLYIRNTRSSAEKSDYVPRNKLSI